MVSEAEAPATKQPRNNPHALSLAIRLQVRSMYVQNGHAPSTIANALSLDLRKVTNLIYREGWTDDRGAVVRKAEKVSVARTQAAVNEVVEAVAQRTEELSVRTLDLCDEVLTKKDAKSLQMASGAAMNFVKMARLCRELDKPAEQSGSDRHVNIFVMRCDSPVTSERNVSEVTTQLPDSDCQIVPISDSPTNAPADADLDFA